MRRHFAAWCHGDRRLPIGEQETELRPGYCYLLNNYNPGHYADGTNAYADIANPLNTVLTIPPSSLRKIGECAVRDKSLVRPSRGRLRGKKCQPLNRADVGFDPAPSMLRGLSPACA